MMHKKKNILKKRVICKCRFILLRIRTQTPMSANPLFGEFDAKFTEFHQIIELFSEHHQNTVSLNFFLLSMKND